MNKYIYMQVLLAMTFFGVMHGAAQEGASSSVKIASSTQRVLGYFNSVGDAVEQKSEKLRDGIRYFFGASDAAKDLKKSALSIRSALGAMDVHVSRRAYLYGAALLLVSGVVDHQSYSTAGKIAEKIICDKNVLPIDRIRAYILLDEIMHVSNGSVPLNISKLRELVENQGGKWISALKDSHDALAQEYMFRLARSFYYDGGGEYGSCLDRAGMTLSFINNNEEVEDLSLRIDIADLHDRIINALPKNEYADLGASVDELSLVEQGSSLNVLRRSPTLENFIAFEQPEYSEVFYPSVSNSFSRPLGLRPSGVLSPEEWAGVCKAVRSSSHSSLAHETGCCDAECMASGSSTAAEPVVHENISRNPSSSNGLSDDSTSQTSAKRGGSKKEFSLTKYHLRNKKFRGK